MKFKDGKYNHREIPSKIKLKGDCRAQFLQLFLERPFCILAHGQSIVGIAVFKNKEILEHNLKERCLISQQRLIFKIFREIVLNFQISESQTEQEKPKMPVIKNRRVANKQSFKY